MGCDIHIITQIKKGDKWEYVDDVPQPLDERNYKTFSVLAGVRDSFNLQVFEAKGLPPDMEVKKFRFKSDHDWHIKNYNSGKGFCLKIGDKYIYYYSDDDMIKKTRKEVSQEEYERILQNKSDKVDSDIRDKCNERYVGLSQSFAQDNVHCFVDDASIIGGKWVWYPYNKIFASFEEFEKTLYEDDWNEDAQDYGYYAIDFECEDYHTPSYLTLKELLDADYSDYKSKKCKVPKAFIDAFQKAGGVFPDGFKLQKSSMSDIRDVFAEAFDPTVTVVWQDDNDRSDLSVIKGIEELEEIAKKYGIENPENIRIVFAFDN